MGVTQLEIILIEDDKLQRKALHGIMTGWGHNVEACDCLHDARKLMSKNSFDLILLDMCLPDGNGLDFLEEQKKDGLAADIVIMTAFADIKSALDAIKRGAYDYLPKPFEDEQLKKILRNLTGKVDLSHKVSSLSQMPVGNYDDVWRFDDMIGTKSLKLIFDKAQRVAQVPDTTVLILGESGTGKGMLAKAVHRFSSRANQPFVDINCSAIPGQLIESEVFGYEKGAFTDAKLKKPGLLEIADGGTVFLDEIGDMELNLQSKLLKVIEDKQFRRLGGSGMTKVDVRVIAATSRDLKELVKTGKFREDLYYRLSVVPIEMPPLREHKTTIEPLAEYYLTGLGKEMGRTLKGFTPEAMSAMMKYSWPGNIRELRNAVERSVILATGEYVDADVLGLSDGLEKDGSSDSSASDGGDFKPMTMAECEKRLIQSVLKSVDSNKNKAAEVLQIHRTTLYKKLEEYGLK